MNESNNSWVLPLFQGFSALGVAGINLVGNKLEQRKERENNLFQIQLAELERNRLEQEKKSKNKTTIIVISILVVLTIIVLAFTRK